MYMHCAFGKIIAVLSSRLYFNIFVPNVEFYFPSTTSFISRSQLAGLYVSEVYITQEIIIIIYYHYYYCWLSFLAVRYLYNWYV